MQNDALRQMIAERQSRRDKLRGQLDALELELKVLNEVLVRIGSERPNSTEKRARSVSDQDSKERALKSVWAATLRHIGQLGKASLDALMAWSDLEGMGIKRNTLRSQMSIYGDRGWVERVSDGVYRLTDEGAVKCGFIREARNDEADAAATDIGPSSEGEALFRDPAQAA